MRHAPDDDLWTKYLINSAEWYKYASKIVKKAALETTNTSAAEKCLGEQKKGVQSEYGLLVKAISVANTTNIPANATSNNSNHCKHSARVSENSLPAKKNRDLPLLLMVNRLLMCETHDEYFNLFIMWINAVCFGTMFTTPIIIMILDAPSSSLGKKIAMFMFCATQFQLDCLIEADWWL